MGDTRQNRRVGDLVAVEVEDGQNRAVCGWIEELVRVPACSQGAGLGLAIAHHAGHDQVRIVKGRAVGMNQRVAQFAAFVDRAGSLRGHVAGNPIGPTELPEEPLDAVLVLLDVRIDLGVGALKVSVRHNPRTAVPWADDEQHVQVALADQAIPVHIEKVEPRRGAPVAQQARLHVVQGERALQQRIVLEVDLADRKIVGGSPVGVHLGQLVRTEGAPARCFFAHIAPRIWNLRASQRLAAAH